MSADTPGLLHRTDGCGRLTEADAAAGREVVLTGWVHRRRDLGQLIFIEVRDRTGTVQVVFDAPAFRLPEDHDDGCECRELWAYVRDAFGLDDAEYGPDEITPWYDPREPGREGWRLWWD